MFDLLNSLELGSPWADCLGLNRLDSEILKKRIQMVDVDLFPANADKPKVAWLGHASFLIVWRGLRILIDPVFSSRVGVMPRRIPVSKGIGQLKPDVILLSHAHMDHFDNATLVRYPDAEIYLPSRSETFLRPWMRKRALGLDVGAKLEVGPLSLSCIPALHGGWRYPWQKGFRACGYVLSDGETTLFFAGDTAYGSLFKDLGVAYEVDIAMLPIGAYSPQWFLKSRHLNPDEAVQAFCELGAKTLIPFHFGTYRLSLERLNEPLPWFAEAAEKEGIDWSVPIGRF
jgi:L-ascorbate metabolism protein UlaG (beta-lactamase superfamily)